MAELFDFKKYVDLYSKLRDIYWLTANFQYMSFCANKIHGRSSIPPFWSRVKSSELIVAIWPSPWAGKMNQILRCD